MRPSARPIIALAGAAAVAAALARAWRREVVPPARLPEVRREGARRLAFAGAVNFRDMGGYPAEGGRRLRWGALYRSDHLHRLTGADLAAFARLGIVTVVDLRSDVERRGAPDRLPPGGPRVVEIPIFDEGSVLIGGLRERFRRGDLSGFDAGALLTEANREFVRSFTPQFRRFVGELLAAGGEPVLFHCTAGKDRTGFAAALALRLLGAPEEVVLADYLRSGAYTVASRRRDLLLLRLFRGAGAANELRNLLDVRPEYLRAAFEAIDSAYGSFEAYAREGLGLSDEDVARLRAQLLEDPPAG